MRTKYQKYFRRQLPAKAMVIKPISPKHHNYPPWNASFHYTRSQTSPLNLLPILTLKCNQKFKTVIKTSAPKKQFTISGVFYDTFTQFN